ncbi:M20/M25/M40 family metallo-hydrolase [Armatimonas sp.]|uniref:M20/M25/M40 family metallo-hydrolase n=1 Tax=Armatimonas sp. TaxID=1872638 RepID=UPI00286B9D3D|nr:M20/M25/M40 family metallo-hydrolase [Armatimonas sp.]
MKADALVRRVAQGALEKTVRSLAAIPTRHTLSGARGADAAAAWLEKELRSYGGNLQVAQQRWVQPAGGRMTKSQELGNVLATLPGTDMPERVIVVSGHYDSRVTDVLDATSPAPGANDDASGVAVVLECARLMANLKPRCTVIFAAVTGEEQSLLGSAQLAKSLKEQGKQVVAMATYDIVGNSVNQEGKRDDKHIRVFSTSEELGELPTQATRRKSLGTDGDSPARTLARAIADSARRQVKGISVSLTLRNDRYGRGGDHSSFLAAGYPASVRFTEPGEDWRHQHQDLRVEKGVKYGDLPEFVDYAYLTRVTQVALAWLSELADAPPAPIRATLKQDLSNATTLTWSAVAGAVSYDVLWRRTTEPDWSGQKAFSATQATLPLSKDDYLFGVRAVGQNGARGLPTTIGR